MKRFLSIVAFAALCCSVAGAANAPKLNYRHLNAMARKEYRTPVRPFVPGTTPCWNHYAKDFKYAPVFDFPRVDSAVKYRYTVYQNPATSYFWTVPMQQRPDDKFPSHHPTDLTAGFFEDLDISAENVLKWSFTASTPNESLAPIWEKIPVGNSCLVVEGIAADGSVAGEAGRRLFIRDFPFEGPYPAAVRPYREAALRAAWYVHTMPGIQYWKTHSEPDLGYKHNTYACKIIGSTIRLEVLLARLAPEASEECMTIARNAARFLMVSSGAPGTPTAYFPPTYYKGKIASAAAENQGNTMMMEASMAGQAFLDMYDYTGEREYLDFALGIAATYAALQAQDGSFPVKINISTGKTAAPGKAMLHHLLLFLQRIHKQYGIDTYMACMKSGQKWMQDNPVSDFDWHGQFEDVSVLGWKPYQNLTNATSAPYASYLLRGDSVSDADLKDVDDIMRFCEDQFVHWNALPNRKGFRQIPTPGVYEQYQYRVPIDCSNSNVANAWLDLYQLNGDLLAFAKAKALVDAIVAVQNACNGRIETTWDMRPFAGDMNRAFWVNCSLASIQTILRMAELTGETIFEK